jgi:hypothetical protein
VVFRAGSQIISSDSHFYWLSHNCILVSLISYFQAVHPELGGFLSSLERRLELDVRGVSSGGGITQLPQACDIITAVRSVGWISRGAGLNGQSSQHNDVYVLLNLPSFRSTTERSFWFGDSTSSGGAAAVGGRGVGGLNAPGPVPTVRKSIAPLNLQVRNVVNSYFM